MHYSSLSSIWQEQDLGPRKRTVAHLPARGLQIRLATSFLVVKIPICFKLSKYRFVLKIHFHTHFKWGKVSKVSEKWGCLRFYFPAGYWESLVSTSGLYRRAGKPPCCRGRMPFWGAYVIFWLKLNFLPGYFFPLGKTYVCGSHVLLRRQSAKLCDRIKLIPWVLWANCWAWCREIFLGSRSKMVAGGASFPWSLRYIPRTLDSSSQGLGWDSQRITTTFNYLTSWVRFLQQS